MLPWWAGVCLAVLSYLVFASLAGKGAPAILPNQVGAGVAGTFISALSKVLQFLVPLLCLAGAGLSAWRRRERAGLLSRATGSDTSLEVSRMTWRQFELLVGEAFRGQGFAVAELGGAGPDGGVDLVLTKDGARYLVQCKQWKAFKVGVSVVRELYGVMAAQRAAGGFLVTSGRLTEEARAFAAGKNITLIDGERLPDFLRREQLARPAAPGQQATSQGTNQFSGTAQGSRIETVPDCPRCSKPMVRRVARQGVRSGQAFWGCSDYPSCRGTLSADS